MYNIQFNVLFINIYIMIMIIYQLIKFSSLGYQPLRIITKKVIGLLSKVRYFFWMFKKLHQPSNFEQFLEPTPMLWPAIQKYVHDTALYFIAGSNLKLHKMSFPQTYKNTVCPLSFLDMLLFVTVICSATNNTTWNVVEWVRLW